MFRTEENHFVFSGKMSPEILPAYAALHNVIHKSKKSSIILDFSQVLLMDPSFMLPFATTVRNYRREKIDFEIILPADQKQSKLILNANWAHLMMPEKYEPRDDINVNHLSAIQFVNSDQHFDAIDRTIKLIFGKLSKIDRSNFQALEWALNEITDNVINHAESPIGGIVQVVFDSKDQKIHIYVCDTGIGIPVSLRAGLKDVNDNVSALRFSIQEGVTKNKKTNQGNGLFGTSKCCSLSGGYFEIVSSDAYLLQSKESLTVTRSGVPFKGTFVHACIKYNAERLLDRALVFKGKPHQVHFDFIDRFYSNDEGVSKIVMKDEFTSFGTREIGRMARARIQNIIKAIGGPIIIDFTGIDVISSSFADEVFGKIYIEIGHDKFREYIKFGKSTPTISRIIERSVAQRLLTEGDDLDKWPTDG